VKKKISPKQIIAITGVVLLTGMYVVSLILAIIGSPVALNLLRMSFLATIIIPILIYVILMFYRLSHKKSEPEDKVYAKDEDDPFNDDSSKAHK
jgi:putative hydrolase of the HAD superfamily